MTDIVDTKTRSRMMSGIRGKNTKPELVIRKALFARGFRYRLYDKKLPGKPDLVLPKYSAVIFVNGCFWHQHNCHLFKWPSTRREFWEQKIIRNVQLDRENRVNLKKQAWRILTVWECAIKGKTRLDRDEMIDEIVRWLKGSEMVSIIQGRREPQ